jgi:hypothetical protein
MVKPSHLKEIEQDGYYPRAIYRSVLEDLNVSGVEEEHNSMESAIFEINQKKEKLKHLTLTILPVFNINYEGEIR